MSELSTMYEVFQATNADGYQRAGEQLLEIAGLANDPKGIHFAEDGAVQWRHSNPPTICRVIKHEEGTFQLDVVNWRSHDKLMRISTWVFGKEVGLVPVIDEVMPITSMQNPSKAIEMIRPKVHQLFVNGAKYAMPVGETKSRFISELYSHTSNTPSNKKHRT
jgi:hypothetical protein